MKLDSEMATGVRNFDSWYAILVNATVSEIFMLGLGVLHVSHTVKFDSCSNLRL